MKPFAWAIFFEALIRKLAYPSTIAAAIWVIDRVSVAKGDFWSPEQYGLAMLVFAMSGLAVAVIRLADGRFDTDGGTSTRRNASYAAGVWLAAIAISGAVVLVFALAKRLPDRLDWPPPAKSQFVAGR